MPGFDGTGPGGMGPMTGGGRGFCTTPLRSAWPRYAWRGRYMPYPHATPLGEPYGGLSTFPPQATRKEEISYLRGLARSMNDDLKDIEARIQELESEKD